MSENIFKHAKWICTKDFLAEKPINLFHKQLDKQKPELPEHLKNIHMLTRKKLYVKKKFGSKYKIRITADDYYKLYINGRFVCQGPAQGCFFSYNYNEADVTEFLCEGENEIFADVYYQAA